MGLQNELDRLSAELQDRFPPRAWEELSQIRARIAELGVGDQVPAPGGLAPDFSLPDTQGRLVRLAERLQSGAVILNFYRGGWCDYCNLELRALQRKLEKAQQQAEGLGASLLAISPQTVGYSLQTAEKAGLTFPLLSDAGNEVARRYGLVHALDARARQSYRQNGVLLPQYNGDERWELPHPATFVIAPDGRIRWTFANADFTRRADPDEVFAVLEQLRGAH